MAAWPTRGVKVAIVGQGYVGLPLAIRSVEVGHDVVAFDVDSGRVQRLRAADSYVEDISSSQLAEALATGRYLPTADRDDLAGFDVALITVPTPLKDGGPDLSFIEDAGRTLASHLEPGATVVLESTTYPGTTDELLANLLAEGSGLVAGRDFHLGYSPERIDPGNKVFGLVGTPKVVSGITAGSLEAVQRFYDSIVDKTIPVSGPREAELTKLIENTFRHVNVALVNELAMFAADLGVDVWEALDAAGTKPFGFMRFNPGPGVGGHCLPIDPSYLSWRVRTTLGQSFRFVELANDVNDHMPEYVVKRLMVALNTAQACDQREPYLADWARLQAEHLRHAGVPRNWCGAAAGAPRGRRPVCRRPHTGSQGVEPRPRRPVRTGPSHGRRARVRLMPWLCLPTTTTLTTTWFPNTLATFSIRAIGAVEKWWSTSDTEWGPWLGRLS